MAAKLDTLISLMDAPEEQAENEIPHKFRKNRGNSLSVAEQKRTAKVLAVSGTKPRTHAHAMEWNGGAVQCKCSNMRHKCNAKCSNMRHKCIAKCSNMRYNILQYMLK